MERDTRLKQYKLDIIVPVYNGERYIGPFFDMLEKQANSLQDLRVIFVDDGSTDSTSSLIKERGNNSKVPIKLISQGNCGVSAARNNGLYNSTAEYISFFDVDDIFSEDYINVIKHIIDNYLNFDLFVFQQRRIRDDSDTFVDYDELDVTEYSNEMILNEFLLNPTKYGVYNLLISNAWFKTTGISFLEGSPYYEDYDFLVRVFVKANTILYTSKQIYGYAMREQSAMTRFSNERIRCLANMFKLESVVHEYVDMVADDFQRWFVSRLYWSVLWQVALGSDSFKTFKIFQNQSYAKLFIKKLKDYPDKKVRISSKLFLVSKRLFYFIVKLMARKHSLIESISIDDIKGIKQICPDPRKIVIYGMTSNPGGIESYVMGLFRRQRNNPFAFICDFPDIAYREEIRTTGTKVYHIPAKRKTLFGHMISFSKILKEHPEYTTVYFNVLDSGCLPTAIVAWTRGRRIVVHSHNSSTDKKRLHALCYRPLNIISGGKVACSTIAAKYMFGKKYTEAIIIPNMIDVSQYAFNANVRGNVRNQLGIEKNIVVIHVGRISYQKNPFFIVDIMKEIVKIDQNVILLHVGVGELEEKYVNYIHDCNLDQHIKLLGVRTDVNKLLQAGDVFVLPSLYEGLPIALLEAQAAGLPSVVSDVITKEAEVSDLLVFKPLTDGADSWAKEIYKQAHKEREHESYHDVIKHGFDISSSDYYDEELMHILKGDN